MGPSTLARFIAATALAVSLQVSAAEPVLLSPTNATWRYFKGTAEPAPGNPAAWRPSGFADATWPVGPAPFWYGESALFGGTGSEITDMQNAYSTLYLRRSFPVTNPAAFESLELQFLCDDGFMAWINGTQVANVGGPTGQPAYNSVASINAGEPVALTSVSIPNPGALLKPGDNTLAVQVFNTSLGSSDLVFDAQLVAQPTLAGPPTIVAVTPTPGPVHSLGQIAVTFSEPVRGVRADDFLINGQSATQVSGSGTTYTFTFPQPHYGAVEIGWSTFHTVEDLGTPPTRFELGAPGSTWGYELMDPDGPSVTLRLPPANATLRSLAQVAVTFNKAVRNLDAADLTLNGVPARQVTGIGAGPYLFEFASASAGEVRFSWAPDHGIESDVLEPHAFNGGDWSCTIDPSLPVPRVSITEIMAENLNALKDEDADPEDWIELHNEGSTSVNLEGWSLSNDSGDPSLWVLPAVTLAPDAYLVVFASAKDRSAVTPGRRLHTNFKLNPNGGTLALFAPELPRAAVSEVPYDSQGADYSWGRDQGVGAWRYFRTGSPGQRNPASTIQEAVAPVHFSVERGFFARAFQLHLSCTTPGAQIRFTTNGSPPTELQGFLYSSPISIHSNRVIRAAAFKTNGLPSPVATHTYLVNQTGTRLRLPALSLVTATNNLYGRSGIMEVSPRNTTQRGPAWERPVSVELIRVEDNGGFQVDCGLRLQGGDYVRGQYNYRSTSLPFSKYSFRLYFRGEYGQGRLEYPLFPETTQSSFDTVVLRAGMNDHSNPYLIDEFVRDLARDCGQPSPAGTFVHLFLNGVYKGYYNPCERVDVDFLRAYHGGGDRWDLMAQLGEVREGDATAWNALRTLANTKDLSLPEHYRDVASRLDLTNFVDYLCPLIYVDNDDWPHNNWRAARERTTNGLYRMYVWDAEWAVGSQNGHAPTWNTIVNQLSSVNPPWGGTDIQRLFNGLKKSPEFRLFVADRVHRHFFNGGALTDDRIRSTYAQVTNRLNGVVSGFNNRIGTVWIPQRRRNVLLHFERAGMLASSNAPAFSQHGGNVAVGYRLVITNLAGSIYYTTNGADPRISFTGQVAPDAFMYQDAIPVLAGLHLRARSLNGTNWSAVTEADFSVNRLDLPLRFTEIMFHPPGGDAFEFIELSHLGDLPLDLSGFTLDGVDFRFPNPTPPMPPGARWILANDSQPTDFAARYPGVEVVGWFGGSLNNGGERLALRAVDGTLITSVTYGDALPWPSQADGDGSSLEWLATLPEGDPNDPSRWFASATAGGTPGLPNPMPALDSLRLSEIAPGTESAPDWIEIENFGTRIIDLAGSSLIDRDGNAPFHFPAGATLAPAGRLRVWLVGNTPSADDGWQAGFRLDRDGEILVLADAQGVRVDAVTFGRIPSGFSLGRLGTDREWSLCEPTPLARNEPAQTADAGLVVLNECLPNPPPGDEDWIELHNTDTTRPAPLLGLTIAVSNQLARLGVPSFVPASGFVVLKADDKPGPDHLALKLPASGASITLYDASGTERSRVTYGNAQEGIALGRIPDGTGTPIVTPGTASPGASNYLAHADGPRIHEWMARNATAVRRPDGTVADWVELFNPATTTFDLTGCTLDTDQAKPWKIPPGVHLGPRSFLVLWCDGSRPGSTNNTPVLETGFNLGGEGSRLRLSNPQGQRLDEVIYGAQLVNQSVGTPSTGGSARLLVSPTPGASNTTAAEVASSAEIRLNEWLAGNPTGDDWIELYNPGTIPADIGGWSLTDDPSLAGVQRHVFPPLTLIAPGGFQHWLADGDASLGLHHLPFRLDGHGESLRLYDSSRALRDAIDFAPQPTGVSSGRFPDGSDAILDFPRSASPGSGNWRPHPGVVINELLTHTDPPLEDAIELHNASASAVDLGGWYLSDDPEQLRKFVLPSPSLIEPGGFLVLFESLFHPTGHPLAFTLNSAHGGTLWLSEPDPAGGLTGRRIHAAFEALANGVSLGRHRTSLGWTLAPQSRRTFGKDAPTSIDEFRQSRGLPNAYPSVGPIAITELHFRPITGAGTNEVETPEFEFVELHNRQSQTVALYDPAVSTNTWRLRGGVDFEFPLGSTLAPGQFAVVLNFPPTNTTLLAEFKTRYGTPAGASYFGPFRGRLSDQGEAVRLERPDTPQAPPSADAGFVPWLLVEVVEYGTDAPWPNASAIPGASLQRWHSAEYANDPANWVLNVPSPGSGTQPPMTDRDFDGMPNDWETTYGLDPDSPADASLDADHDGQTNFAELLAGTHPRDATSRLAIRLEWVPSAGVAVRFDAMAQRTYSVLQRADAERGLWIKVADVPADYFDRTILVPVTAPPNGVQFYQVITPAQP
ncbi:MAG: lamin tail domain-containing protein [Verrucomicrobiales bacterium]|nr:lamin tail domain-containing protein [Verrucomicrobiales bacterium]